MGIYLWTSLIAEDVLLLVIETYQTSFITAIEQLWWCEFSPEKTREVYLFFKKQKCQTNERIDKEKELWWGHREDWCVRKSARGLGTHDCPITLYVVSVVCVCAFLPDHRVTARWGKRPVLLLQSSPCQAQCLTQEFWIESIFLLLRYQPHLG